MLVTDDGDGAAGQHHCILCGNRFKYDYNLLYHYRHSCPYTKAFIHSEARETLDSNGIRKLVRALHQKHVRAPIESRAMII